MNTVLQLKSISSFNFGDTEKETRYDVRNIEESHQHNQKNQSAASGNCKVINHSQLENECDTMTLCSSKCTMYCWYKNTQP